MQKTLVESESWIGVVYRCILRLGKPEFTLDEVYGFEQELSERYPENRHVREKIRQQLQRLRDLDQLEFVGAGIYRLK